MRLGNFIPRRLISENVKQQHLGMASASQIGHDYALWSCLHARQISSSKADVVLERRSLSSKTMHLVLNKNLPVIFSAIDPPSFNSNIR